MNLHVPITILHVEDDDNDAFLVERAFRKAALAARLLRVSDGREALEYLNMSGDSIDGVRSPVPSVMLLDLKLPEVDGFAVLAWTRADSRLRELTVFVLSSSDQPSDMAEAFRLGANRYFVKTLGFKDVIAAVTQLVGPSESLARVSASLPAAVLAKTV
jgi:DNA-binding response OmpR family regulator